MKRTISVIIIYLFAFPLLAQEPAVIDQKDRPSNDLKPLMVIVTGNDTLRVNNAKVGLNEIDLELVESFNIYKGESAITLFGKEAKHGVILMRIFDNDKARSSLKDLIQSSVKPVRNQHEKMNALFSIGKNPLVESSTYRSGTNKKLKFKDIAAMDAMFILSIDHEKAYLNQVNELEEFESNLLKSVQVLKTDEAKRKYNSNGKDILILEFKETEATKRLFEKLKKVKDK